MAHGSGGSMMHELIDNVFLPAFGSGDGRGDDAFVSEPITACADGTRLVLSTDTFVVMPRFFPGGDIGRLAVCGTVNDVATSGADVRYLSCGFVIEEGFPIDELKRVCDSMAKAADEAGVEIVTGDTKVVERGSCDGLYINTAGVGLSPAGRLLSGTRCQPGDMVLLSGTIGDHGIAVISQREGLGFATDIVSDCAPLNHMVSAVLAAAPGTRCFRDPTRGGLAGTLNEFARQSNVAIEVEDEVVPVDSRVRACCDMLGYDVFQVANEGKLVAVVPPDGAEAALEAMRSSAYGENAAIIGTVVEPGVAGPIVTVRTALGATRIMDTLTGEQLPRIC